MDDNHFCSHDLRLFWTRYPTFGSFHDYFQLHHWLIAQDTSVYAFDGTTLLLKRINWTNGEAWSYNYTSGKLTEVVDSAYDIDASGATVYRRLQFVYYNNAGSFDDGLLWRVGDHTNTSLTGTPTGRYIEFTYATEKLSGINHIRTGFTLPQALLSSVRDTRTNVWSYNWYGKQSSENILPSLSFLTETLSPLVDTNGDGTSDSTLKLKELIYTLSSGDITAITEKLGVLTVPLQQNTYTFATGNDREIIETIGTKQTKYHFNGDNGGVFSGITDPALKRRSEWVGESYRVEIIEDANENQTNLIWSDDGKKLESVLDALWNETKFSYDEQDRLTVSTDAEGNTTEYIYGDMAVPRQATVVKVKKGTATLKHQEFTYDSKGRTLVEKILDPNNPSIVLQQTTRVYNTSDKGNGFLQSVTQVDIGGGNNTVLTYAYDIFGRTVKTTQTSNFGNCNSTFTLFDNHDNVIASICNYESGTDPINMQEAINKFNPTQPTKNKVTVYEYDSMNRRVKTRVIFTNDNVTTTERISLTLYDALSRVSRTIENYIAQATPPRNWVYNETAKRWEDGVMSPAPISHIDTITGINRYNVISDTEYNARGNVRLRRDPLGNVTLFGYDDADRLVKTAQNASNSAYNNEYGGDVSLAKYPTGLDNPILSAEPDLDLVTSQFYDANGNLQQTVDVRGISSFTIYDALNRPIKTVQNAKPEATIQYNVGHGSYVATNDPRNISYGISSDPDCDHMTETVYDVMGRVSSTKRLMENRTTFEWDETRYVYDSLGRQRLVVQHFQHFSDPNGWIWNGSEWRDAQNNIIPHASNASNSSNLDINLITETQYDTNGRAFQSLDVNRRITRTVYNGLGQPYRTITNYVANGEDPSLWVWSVGNTRWQKSTGTPIHAGTITDQNIISHTEYGVDVDPTGGISIDKMKVRYTQNVMGYINYIGYDDFGRQNLSVTNWVGNDLTGVAGWNWDATNVPPRWEDGSNVAIPRGGNSDQNVISFTTYDEQGRVLETRDVRGNVSRMVYDVHGRRTRTIANYVSQGSSNPANWVLEAGVWKQSVGGIAITHGSNDQNLITDTVYDRIGRVESTRDTLGNVSLILYDRAGRRVRSISNYVVQGTSKPKDWLWSSTNNRWENGAGVAISHGAKFDQNHISDTVYTKAGQVPSTRDARGTVTAFYYDNAGRRLKMIMAATNPTEPTYFDNYTCYDKVGRVLRGIQNYQPITGKLPDTVQIATDGTRQWDFNPETHGANSDVNLINESFYDAASRVIRSVNPVGDTQKTTYGKDGLTLESTDPLNIVTVYRYDALSRRVMVVQNYNVPLNTPDPSLWTWSTSNNRWESSANVAVLHDTTNDRNVIVRLTYDLLGRIKEMREPRGNVTTYQYDKLGRRTELSNPLSQEWLTAFEDTGGTTKIIMTYPNNHVVTRNTDKMGRAASILYNDASTPNVEFTYDLASNRISMTEKVNTTTIRGTQYEYDLARRMTAVKNDTDGVGGIDETVSYAYDVRGQRTQLTMPGSLTVIYEYSAKGELVKMTDWSSQQTQFAYDGNSRHIATLRANGVITTDVSPLYFAQPTLPVGIHNIAATPYLGPTGITLTPGVAGLAQVGLADAGCSSTDKIIDLIYSWDYPAREVQELKDMGVTTANGIWVLSGPSINAAKVVEYDWGTRIKVYSRILFPQTGYNDQLWYQVSLDSQTTFTGWIVVRYENQGYIYRDDPCGILATPSPTETLTFAYDRAAVRDYAVAQSYANISSPLTNRVSRNLTGVPYADFYYADLGGSGESTASAIFVSEVMWMGGLPMTVGNVNSCAQVIGTEGGWRYCKITVGEINELATPGPFNNASSTTWEVHKALGSYYTNGIFYIPSFSYPNSIINPKSNQITFSGTGFTDKLSVNDIAPFMNIPVYNGIVGTTQIANFDNFARQYLGTLEAGDYVWTDPPPTPHGLIVIGWSSIVNCEIARTNVFLSSSFYTSLSQVPESSDVVPWVTDFGTAQAAVPRPFYCTRYWINDDPNTGFAVHDWRFYRIPSSVAITPNKLYTNIDWQW